LFVEEGLHMSKKVKINGYGPVLPVRDGEYRINLELDPTPSSAWREEFKDRAASARGSANA
jgi:hypothetical protein